MRSILFDDPLRSHGLVLCKRKTQSKGFWIEEIRKSASVNQWSGLSATRLWIAYTAVLFCLGPDAWFASGMNEIP